MSECRVERLKQKRSLQHSILPFSVLVDLLGLYKRVWLTACAACSCITICYKAELLFSVQWPDWLVFVSVSRPVPPHGLRRLPHPACHSLRGCALPAPTAGCSQTSSDHRAQPRSHSGLLPPSPPPVHEYEHELHRVLPQVGASSAMSSPSGKKHPICLISDCL